MDRRRAAWLVLRGLIMMTLSTVACANPDSPHDYFQLGWQEYQAGHYDSALGYWVPLADQGDANAQLNVGMMYDTGQGVAEDPARAVRLYRQSAERGHPAAQYNLGMMYASGRGIERDAGQAKFWLEQAAVQGLQNARAQLPEYTEKSSSMDTNAVVPERSYILDMLNGAATGTAWPVAVNYAVTSNHVVDDVDAVILYDASGNAAARYRGITRYRE